MERLFGSRGETVSAVLRKFFNKRKRDYQRIETDRQPKPFDIHRLSPRGRLYSVKPVGEHWLAACNCGAKVHISEPDAYLRLLTGVGCGSLTCPLFEPQDVWRHPQPGIEAQAALLAFSKYRENSEGCVLDISEVRDNFTDLLWESADLIAGMWVFNYVEAGEVRLNGKSRSKLLRCAEGEVLHDHTGNSILFSDLMLLNDASKQDVLAALTVSNTVNEITENIAMKVHGKESDLAKYFNAKPLPTPKKASALLEDLLEKLSSVSVGEVIEVTELAWDYQTSNLRKGLITRGVPREAFTCRRPGTDLDGKPIPREERPLIVIKLSDFVLQK